MSENPQLSNSPFLRRAQTETGESFKFSYHPARRDGFKFHLSRKASLALTVLIVGALVGFILKTSSFPGLISPILALWAVAGLWRGASQIQPTEILIEVSILSFLPPTSDAIQFSDVRIYEESVSHIDIYHEQISGLSKFRLLRHEFHAPDWDQLGPILQDRVRHHSPNARIHTPLNPPDRRLFQTNASDHW
jgi:hypothetical protein